MKKNSLYKDPAKIAIAIIVVAGLAIIMYHACKADEAIKHRNEVYESMPVYGIH